MSKEITWPESWNKYFKFLDDIRDSGVTNMFGASEYLEENFGLNHMDAIVVLTLWMKTFSQRHPGEDKK
ncbi:MAG: hypothetical protein QQN44_06245 [Nitrosopumilus sp.]